MKFSVYTCELCRTTRPAAEVNVIDCRFEKGQGITSMTPTDGWHTGVRVVCKRCTNLLAELAEPSAMFLAQNTNDTTGSIDWGAKR